MLVGLNASEAVEAFGVGVQPQELFGSLCRNGIILEGVGGMEVKDKEEISAGECEYMVVLVDFHESDGLVEELRVLADEGEHFVVEAIEGLEAQCRVVAKIPPPSCVVV